MEILIDQIQYRYPNGVNALADVSLRVAAGEQVAIVGQNGSGKTTMAKHLNGLLRPSRGRVTIGDWATDDHSVAQMARRVGYLFQHPDEQLFQRTVAAEVAFGPRNLGFAPQQVETLVAEALASLELTAVAQENPYDLSLAWRKRVALAAVLAMDTPILVLDEPTTGQDARFQVLLAQLLADWRQCGKTVIAISHDMEFVAAHFARLVVMHAGQVLRDGLTAEVVGETAVLQQTHVEPPAITRLAQGLTLPQTVWTIPDFLEVWRGNGRNRKS
ncbi:MAG: ATP-binding cassette domain-containing protein [Ardenticatenaceae bacterium]|nr:ATP-binding cassette domain-containing protein [Ardenticatenaceae bacterium]